MQSFLSFDKMITPTIIKIIFYVFSGISILSGFIMMISGANVSYGGGLQVFMGLITLLLGPFLVRIYCELLIVLFKMHEHLHKISKSMDEKPF